MELNRIISNQLAQHATSHPHAPAILALDRAPLSYAGLYYQLYHTVEKLNQLGISRNDPVAIVLPNGPEMAVTFLTVAACATAAPLNPAYRAAEFDFYLGDLNAKAVIVQTTIDSPVRDVAMQRNIPLIELIPDVNTAGLFTLDGEPTRSDTRVEFAEADDVALILHTSGTTSRPKMVPLTQHNICTSAQNIHPRIAVSM